MPLVSLVTVCRNAAADLTITARSVLAQTSRDFEYIIVDGHSSDGTQELLPALTHDFEQAGIPFRYISEQDQGIYDAMNKGVQLAQGEWICYMNAGDALASPQVLAQIFFVSVPDHIAVLYGDAIEEYDFGSVLLAGHGSKKLDPVMPFCHQAAFVRRECMLNYQFDLQYKILGDHDLFYRMRQAGEAFLHRGYIIVRYNARYGVSANHPLKLQLERHRIYGINRSSLYFFRYFYTVIRSGCVPILKKLLPRTWVNAIMKHRRS